jgi:hypothetical protein
MHDLQTDFLTKDIHMKQTTRPGILKHAFMLFLATVANVIAWAQHDSTVTAITQTTSTTTETWYTEPWVWVVGGAVLILIIVALTRGNKGDSNGRTDKVTITKTTSSQSD